MTTRVRSSSLVGVDAQPVDVEIHLGKGLPGFDLVGLAEAAVRESRVRVRAALAHSGFELPPRHLVLNLAPADTKKRGTHFDLAIAIGVLAACGACAGDELESTLVLGELSLSGELRAVTGLLPMLRRARTQGLTRAIVPLAQAREASLVTGLDVRAVATLGECVGLLSRAFHVPPLEPYESARPTSLEPDLSDVRGQVVGKRALEIAAAGQHDLLFVGPPGAGKTMLARRLPGLLPEPSPDERLEAATIASAAGLAPPSMRPFRAPHHTASSAALVGGGEPVRPGEVTLAHGGVLFLDELPELQRNAIESLRTVMESGEVAIARARERVVMPARSIVVGAMNPCPCGYAGDPQRMCKCSPARVESYRGRLSGPLLDRFDLRVWLSPVRMAEVDRGPVGESSALVRARVARARERAHEHGDLERGQRPTNTARLFARHLGELEPEARALLDRAGDRLRLSMRALGRTLRVARTLAHLAEVDRIAVVHVAEALRYRGDLDGPGDAQSAAPASPAR
ncbi:MAG: YifB family Mg chelatase-like AAA ATPase [Sandaracinaceae bacterium]|nr:YifB family Mg chelatase-like AAA ATPase [Sandaracinaceae bacterium]